jgi:hypothetical protein
MVATTENANHTQSSGAVDPATRAGSMKFIHDQKNPRAVSDEAGLIWVLRSTRDLPYRQADYMIKWKGGFPHTVIANEVLSEADKTFTVLINRNELVKRVLGEEYENCKEEAEHLMTLFSEAIKIIKQDQYGNFFGARGIEHVVRFQV